MKDKETLMKPDRNTYNFNLIDYSSKSGRDDVPELAKKYIIQAMKGKGLKPK